MMKKQEDVVPNRATCDPTMDGSLLPVASGDSALPPDIRTRSKYSLETGLAMWKVAQAAPDPKPSRIVRPASGAKENFLLYN